VTGTVRSPQRAKEILDLHPDWKNSVDFAFIPDITTPGAFTEVFEKQKSGFDFIIHNASPVTFNISDIQKELIDPAVKG
jgi:hypothetical protein